jgi:prepilin-type N-terminal cleavage/methylation domain-containing protein
MREVIPERIGRRKGATFRPIGRFHGQRAVTRRFGRQNWPNHGHDADSEGCWRRAALRSGKTNKIVNMKNKFIRRSGFTLVEIMIVVAIIGLLAAIAIPNFVKARTTAQTNACIANLKQIQGAIEMWALETKKGPSAAVTVGDVSGGADKGIRPLINTDLTCPAGGTYGLTTVSNVPTCTVPGHSI